MRTRVPALAALLLSFAVALPTLPPSARAAEVAASFDGGKSTWHEGFERYDFIMDATTLEISPFTAPAGENFAVRDPKPGTRRCVVVAPKKAAPGNPWSWQGCYWDHEPQTEIELLKRGFHIAYISANAELRPGKEWDAWYEFLTAKHGLSPKPAFIGMSRGGEYAYTWATANPTKVSCIYADNPGGNAEMIARLNGLAENDVPLLHVCGSMDPLLGRFSNLIETIYQQMGGRISVMIKDGAGHHPHSLRDPKPIADFIEQSVQPRTAVTPAFAGDKNLRDNFYRPEMTYAFSGTEGTAITCRGARFTGCYDRYTFPLPGVEGTVNVIVPEKAADGTPWVFRAGVVEQDAAVDLALLAKGYHIVTGPVSYNKDGPDLEHWNAVYRHLTGHGFSAKPVMEGAGRAAGEAYAWAIANPGKVSCVYGENPVLHCFMPKAPLLENLAPLAAAKVPLVHVCGSLDPALEDQTRVIEKRYTELGGKIVVIVQEGVSHYPLSPRDPGPVVEAIMGSLK
jgi:hypothetical protein